MIPVIGAIISLVGSLGKSWMEHRKVKSEGKIAITKAKQQFTVAKYEAKSAMDVEAMKGMQFSWKDEYLLILFSIPLVMCFIPGMVGYVGAGFAVLNTTPAWYQWAITGMVAATFGLRTWKSTFIK